MIEIGQSHSLGLFERVDAPALLPRTLQTRSAGGCSLIRSSPALHVHTFVHTIRRGGVRVGTRRRRPRTGPSTVWTLPMQSEFSRTTAR
jgi:hypothetical protein